MLEKRDWQDAIDVQDACNLSGVVHSLARVVSKIREEKDCTGTEYVNNHPIVRLYVSKLMHLSGMQIDDYVKFGDAWDSVQTKIRE